MSQDKTLPGAAFRFASLSSSGSRTNEFGVGEISLGMYRPGHHWPQIDLGQIWFSNPTPEQFEAAKVKHRMPDIDGRNFVDINRRISRKQADYITHLIATALNEKLKGEMPTDDEIDEIMKGVREANYPVNRQKREEEKKWRLTNTQNELLGELRKLADEKKATFVIGYETETRGYIKFFDGIKHATHFTGPEGITNALLVAISAIRCAVIPKTDEEQLAELTEATRNRTQTNYDRVMTETLQQVSDLKDLKN